MEPMKKITHCGGLFSFSVPSNWKHEIEEGGNEVFWDDDAGSGTLRVTSKLQRTRLRMVKARPMLKSLPNEAIPQ